MNTLDSFGKFHTWTSDSFLATVFGTSLWISPPCFAISLTKLELRNEYSWLGIINKVSIASSRFRFINPIWSSYSKSLTALRPLMITVALFACAKSVNKLSKGRISTCLRPSSPCWMSSTRCSIENNGFFLGFRATETIYLSKIFKALRMISICPLVTGSNVPG